MPPHVVTAIAMISLSLPLLAWSLLARPSRLQRRSVTEPSNGDWNCPGRRRLITAVRPSALPRAARSSLGG